MTKYIIEGGKKLQGKMKISGNKNSILPCLAACLLTDQEVTLHNVPNISDVEVFLEILKFLGAKVEKKDNWVKICCLKINKHNLPEDFASKLRASVLLVGPLLARVGKVSFSHPGGDVIGKRSITTHLAGFEKIGFEFKINDLKYVGERSKKTSVDLAVFLEEASVTATENLLLGATLGQSQITLKNCATEPHVVDLCNLLIQMGANITGVGSSTLVVRGVSKLGPADFTIGSDYIELGTYAAMAAFTSGQIEITNGCLDDLEPILLPLQNMGLKFSCLSNNLITVSSGKIVALPKLNTNIWPGFPTDLMSVMIVLATQARGVSLMHDWMYESRMFFVDKLISMGAHIHIADPHRVFISGPTKLSGRNLETPDIRAGMALVLAALVAKGQSVINRAELIERGYENVVEKLTKLGANIKRLEN